MIEKKNKKVHTILGLRAVDATNIGEVSALLNDVISKNARLKSIYKKYIVVKIS